MKRFCAIAIAASTSLLGAQDHQAGMIEWPYVGAEQSHTKYSPAAEITRANVDQLEVVWGMGSRGTAAAGIRDAPRGLSSHPYHD